MDRYLRDTKLLNYKRPEIIKLIAQRGWSDMTEKEQIISIYNYIRDEIKFGFNIKDSISATQVLADGYGQCNTKGVLLMSLLRSVGISCRIHGFTVKKEIQKGALSGLWYRIAPAEIIHSWVEISYKGEWLNIEGFIVDLPYLTSLQKKFAADCKGGFCGFGVATDSFKAPEIYWDENNTYIQKEGIVEDLGLYDDPDSLFEAHPQRLSPLKRALFENIIRHSMNSNIKRIRNSH